MIPIPGGKIGQAIIDKYFSAEEWEKDYAPATGEIKAISDYAGLSIQEVLELPYSLFLLYRKDAWVYSMQRSEEGRDTLKSLWRLRQTKADEAAIHEFQERGGS